MPKILDRLPILFRDEVAFLRNEMVRLKAYEIIVWISLRVENGLGWVAQTPRFPAILDTGHTHHFSIGEQHLLSWARLRPEMLRLRGAVRHAGQRLPLHAATVWLHRNQPGQRDQFRDVPPYRMGMPQGIVIYPKEANFPRLPLLGLRALLTNQLHLSVDGEHREAFLRTPHWLTRLLRRLRLPPF